MKSLASPDADVFAAFPLDCMRIAAVDKQAVWGKSSTKIGSKVSPALPFLPVVTVSK
jgi:hypothetical protein